MGRKKRPKKRPRTPSTPKRQASVLSPKDLPDNGPISGRLPEPTLTLTDIRVTGNFVQAGISIPSDIDAQFRGVQVHGSWPGSTGIEVRDPDAGAQTRKEKGLMPRKDA